MLRSTSSVPGISDGLYQSTSHGPNECDAPVRTASILGHETNVEISVNSPIEDARDVVDDMVDLTKDVINLKKQRL